MEVDNETQSVVDYAIADQEFMALILPYIKARLLPMALKVVHKHLPAIH